jgi:steroid delta-isomerase-like uncharacterized protein
MHAEDGIGGVAREWLEAFGRGDWEYMEALVLPDATVDDVGSRASGSGASAVVGHLRPWKAAFEDGQCHVKRLVVAGESVWAEVAWEGTHSQELRTEAGAYAATGCRQSTPGVVVFDFEGDRIAHLKNYYDLVTPLVQLGMRLEISQ